MRTENLHFCFCQGCEVTGLNFSNQHLDYAFMVNFNSEWLHTGNLFLHVEHYHSWWMFVCLVVK